jgi:hypothetical protein
MNTRSEANPRKMRCRPPKSMCRIGQAIPQNCDGYLEAILQRRVGDIVSIGELIRPVLRIYSCTGARS